MRQLESSNLRSWRETIYVSLPQSLKPNNTTSFAISASAITRAYRSTTYHPVHLCLKCKKEFHPGSRRIVHWSSVRTAGLIPYVACRLLVLRAATDVCQCEVITTQHGGDVGWQTTRFAFCHRVHLLQLQYCRNRRHSALSRYQSKQPLRSDSHRS